MTKEKSEIFKLMGGILIGVIIAGLFFFMFFKEDSSNEKITLTLEDCKSLADEAGLKKWGCQLELLKEIYGIDYEPYLKNGDSCFYTISDGYCINEATAEYYLNLTDQSCSKSFPKKEDVFAECLSKT